MKKVSFLFITVLTCLISTAALIYANVDFSGEWNLNSSKSELGEWGDRIAPKNLKITSSPQDLTVNRMVSSPEGEDRPLTEKMTFDGKEVEVTLWGNTKKKSTVKWAPDGQSMTVNSLINFDNNGQLMEIKVTELWKLLEGGKTLSIESTSNSDFGTNTMKLLYNKK